MLLNRDTGLAKIPPHEIAEAYGFRMLAEDNMAVNPAVAFRVRRNRTNLQGLYVC